MTIQITGILTNPMEAVSAKTTIRIVSTGNEGGVLIGSPSSITTGTDGSYDFNLVNGTYTVEVLYSKMYRLGGIVTITNVTATPLSLPQLFALAV